jgi:hypothetical protein
VAGLGDLLPDGSSASQFLLWNVFGQIVAAILAPVSTDLQQDAYSKDPGQALSPADLASAVVRNFLAQSDAASEAAQSGINSTRFQTMVDLSGDAPGPEELATALRRSLIDATGTGADSTSFAQGIAEGRLKDKWADTIKALAVEWPTPNDALQAVLQGQVDDATGQALYQLFGGDPDYYTLLYNTRGNAPTPTQGLEMLNRGIIPASGTGPDATSYQQLFLEGPWRNKWLPAFQELAAYVPPPRTVTALERSGVLSADQAQKYYAMQGMDSTLAAVYSQNASIDKLAGTKLLAESVIRELYEAQVLTAAQATTDLNDLGYSNDEAAFVLEVTDLQRELRDLNSGITKVRTLYIGHKVNRSAAVTALGELGVPDAQVQLLFTRWDIEATANVKQLTDTTIAQAVYYGAMTTDEAITELERVGYSNYAAQVFLAVHLNNVQTTPISVVAPTTGLNP